MTNPYRTLARKRAGERLSGEEITAVVNAAADSSWTDAQLAAFLMAAAIRGLDEEETRALTVAMLDSGEKWELAKDFPTLGDKHSTGGVGDKVSLVLAPLLAACGCPVVMLTGRGLGHTAGTADKLEAIEGVRLALDRGRTVQLLDELELAIGVATADIAPADRKFYSLRDQTATVDSLPLITGSILSKKLATGAAALALDVKTGNGAFLQEREEALALARLLVATATQLGTPTSALLTDMSQPLGSWVGHAAEVRETLACLEGKGPENLMDVVFALAAEVALLTGSELSRDRCQDVLASGAARERFERWVVAQGGTSSSLELARLPLAPHETVLTAPRTGVLTRVATRRLGLLLAEAGGGRVGARQEIDNGVSLYYPARLGQRVEAGEEIGRLYLRREDGPLAAQVGDCFTVEEGAVPAPARVILERVTAEDPI